MEGVEQTLVYCVGGAGRGGAGGGRAGGGGAGGVGQVGRGQVRAGQVGRGSYVCSRTACWKLGETYCVRCPRT